LTGQALAQTSPFTLVSGASTTVPLSGGGWRVIPAAPGSSTGATRAWIGRMADLAAPGVEADETFVLAGRAGSMTLQGAVRVGIGDAAGVLVRCLGSIPCAAAIAAVGVGAYYLTSRYRCKASGGTMSGMSCDAGQPQAPFTGYSCGSGFTGNSPSAACEVAFQAWIQASSRSLCQGCTLTEAQPVSCDSALHCTATALSHDPIYGDVHPSWVGTATAATVIECPPVVNFYDPAYSQPGGAPGADGLCPTGNYVATPDEQVKEKIVANPPAPGSNDEKRLVVGVQQAVEQGGQTAPGTISVSGPGTQTGSPVQTTTTDQTGTKTQTQTPSYTYHYAGDTITYDTTITNNTCVAAGSCTSTSTTTSAGPQPPDPKDPCVQNPNSLGCIQLGDPPTDQVQKTTKNLSWASEDPGLPASCPPDYSVSTSHGSIVISYAGACDLAQRINPLVVALGAFVALTMVVAALRNA